MLAQLSFMLMSTALHRQVRGKYHPRDSIHSAQRGLVCNYCGLVISPGKKSPALDPFFLNR